MIRTVLLLSLGLPAIAAAAPCVQSKLAPMPASLPAPEMAIAVPASACARLDAATFAARSREPAPAGPAPAPAAPAPATAAAGTGGYVPKTANDNTPWRFDMNQNGRRMTAEEFDAWMKAKGIRVATGKPAEATPAAQPASNATTGN